MLRWEIWSLSYVLLVRNDQGKGEERLTLAIWSASVVFSVEARRKPGDLGPLSVVE